MYRIAISVVVVVVSMFAASANLSAQEKTTVTAESVVEDYIEALGGRMFLQSQQFTAKLKHVVADKESPSGMLTVYYYNCNGKFAFESVMQLEDEKFSSLLWFDGQSCWVQDSDEATAKKAEAHLPMYAAPSALTYMVGVSEITYQGTSKFNGSEAYHLAAKLESGDTLDDYFDCENGLLLGRKRVAGDYEQIDTYTYGNFAEQLQIKKIVTAIESEELADPIELTTIYESYDTESEIPDDILKKLGEK